MSVLYTTGTFDLLHKAQLEFLKLCKQIVGPAGRVIVGLTTDELAVRQKRKPIMSYMQRRDILVEFPFVDAVVAHNGQTKQEAFASLHFTDLAIGLEYKGTDEYASMEGECRVHYLPCALNRLTSSSELTTRMTIANAHKLRVLASGGPGGLVFLYEDLPEPVVLKAIRVSQREWDGIPGTAWSGPHNTANVYGVPVPPPRNWKKLGDPHAHPNLPGINALREVAVQSLIRDQTWSTVLDVVLEQEVGFSQTALDAADWSHINEDHQHPRQIYWLYMKYAGPTLHDWITSHEHVNMFVPQLQSLVDQVRHICATDLPRLGLIHMDLHARNLCVQRKKPKGPQAVGCSDAEPPDWSVALIDWGWSAHRSFQMDREERDAFEEQLARGFDWKHFVNAMEFDYHACEWFSFIKW